MTDTETLLTAIRELNERPTGLPKSCNPLVSTWIETTIQTHTRCELPSSASYGGCAWCSDDEWPCADLQQALNLARAIVGQATAGTCPCGRSPDPGICLKDCGPIHSAGGHCACVHSPEESE